MNDKFGAFIILLSIVLCTGLIIETLDKEPVTVINKNFTYNKTTYITEEFSSYYQNVKPSKQCSGVELERLRKIKVIYETGSMRPYIYKGDVLLVVNYNPDIDLVQGDVVSNSGILHRITGITLGKSYFYMKGDNNKDYDYKDYLANETDYVVCGVLRNTE